jgi:hypothetical protein
MRRRAINNCVVVNTHERAVPVATQLHGNHRQRIGERSVRVSPGVSSNSTMRPVRCIWSIEPVWHSRDHKSTCPFDRSRWITRSRRIAIGEFHRVMQAESLAVFECCAHLGHRCRTCYPEEVQSGSTPNFKNVIGIAISWGLLN